jgi:hypothetical protein
MTGEFADTAKRLEDFIEAANHKPYMGPPQHTYRESIADPKKPQLLAFCEANVAKLDPQERSDLVRLIEKMSCA